MKNEITKILLEYTNKEISTDEAITKLCDLHNVSISYDLESVKNAQEHLIKKNTVNNKCEGYYETRGGSGVDENGIDKFGFPSY